MAKKNTARRIFLTVLSVLLAVIILAAVLGYAVFNLYIAPKYRQITAQAGNEQSISEKDLLSFAKYLTDKQFIDNLKNFDIVILPTSFSEKPNKQCPIYSIHEKSITNSSSSWITRFFLLLHFLLIQLLSLEPYLLIFLFLNQ